MLRYRSSLYCTKGTYQSLQYHKEQSCMSCSGTVALYIVYLLGQRLWLANRAKYFVLMNIDCNFAVITSIFCYTRKTVDFSNLFFSTSDSSNPDVLLLSKLREILVKSVREADFARSSTASLGNSVSPTPRPLSQIWTLSNQESGLPREIGKISDLCERGRSVKSIDRSASHRKLLVIDLAKLIDRSDVP